MPPLDLIIGFGFGLVVAFGVNAWWMVRIRGLTVRQRERVPEASTPAFRRRTPVCFRQAIAGGETVTLRPGAEAPAGFEADRLAVPTDAPRCFTVLHGHLQAPVSLTVRNDGPEAAVFEATLLGDTPGRGD